ncbi:cation transporter HKT1;3-like [Silene latifolia]|uniref:cation transporter HKT1;3-like n=1 Tax=Silene latifolia TaxID=37657 RepID=UPI003D77BB30
MFIGGEVFTSMVGLHFMSSKLKYTPHKARSRVNSVASLPLPIEGFNFDQIELGNISRTQSTNNIIALEKPKSEIDFLLKSKSIKVLGFMVLAYLLVVHVLGISMVLVYFNFMSNNAKNVLEKKGLKTFTFSIFTIVSTFASCGFIPTNENMIVFRQNSGLLLMLIPQILLGNTLFPSFLRLSIWVLGKFVKKSETEYLLRNTKEIGFLHWLPSKHAKLLVMTVLGFVLVQFILFSSLDWNLQGLNDLNVYQKIVGILFQCINSRHTGESIVDISTVASAMLVVFVVMMYLPPYTSFLPTKEEEEDQHSQNLCNKEENKRKNKINLENVIFSQLSYLTIFIIIICITEREKIKNDPLNFNVLNIVIEVISAYGNVGFSTGYSCARQLKHDATCVDKWYGFVGRWSDQGKIVLIIVMFFGRLKKFNMRGGKAWELL